MSVVAECARSVATDRATSQALRAVRRRRWLERAGVAVLSVVLLVWTLLPIYNMGFFRVWSG